MSCRSRAIRERSSSMARSASSSLCPQQRPVAFAERVRKAPAANTGRAARSTRSSGRASPGRPGAAARCRETAPATVTAACLTGQEHRAIAGRERHPGQRSVPGRGDHAGHAARAARRRRRRAARCVRSIPRSGSAPAAQHPEQEQRHERSERDEAEHAASSASGSSSDLRQRLAEVEQPDRREDPAVPPPSRGPLDGRVGGRAHDRDASPSSRNAVSDPGGVATEPPRRAHGEDRRPDQHVEHGYGQRPVVGQRVPRDHADAVHRRDLREAGERVPPSGRAARTTRRRRTASRAPGRGSA